MENVRFRLISSFIIISSLSAFPRDAVSQNRPDVVEYKIDSKLRDFHRVNEGVGISDERLFKYGRYIYEMCGGSRKNYKPSSECQSGIDGAKRSERIRRRGDSDWACKDTIEDNSVVENLNDNHIHFFYGSILLFDLSYDGRKYIDEGWNRVVYAFKIGGSYRYLRFSRGDEFTGGSFLHHAELTGPRHDEFRSLAIRASSVSVSVYGKSGNPIKSIVIGLSGLSHAFDICK